MNLLSFENIIVVALKYNDIFYAISTPEFNLKKNKILILFETKIPAIFFPFQNLFNEIIIIKYSPNVINILKSLFLLKRKKILTKSSIIFLSNPLLLINRYLIKLSSNSIVILLEDGFFNYKKITDTTNPLKNIFQFFFMIDICSIEKKIKNTYLLYPNEAKYYIGEKKQLILNKLTDFAKTFSLDLNEKSIFVGQNLYDYNFICKNDYIYLVNKFINTYNIDYYLMHIFSSNEQIKCNKLEISKKSITLEILSLNYSFKIYSFSSSVLYTLKSINPNIKTYLIKTKLLNMDVSFLESKVDAVININ